MGACSRRRRAIAVWAWVLVTGCALERSSFGGDGRDAGMDAASAELDAGTDATTEEPMDARAPDDAITIDAAPPLDAPAPDEDTGPPPPPPLCPDDPRLVGCWPLDGEALDHGPRGNDLDASDVVFEPGGGMRLEAASSVWRESAPSLDHPDVTLVAWVRADAFPGGGQRAGIIDRNGHFGLFLQPMGDLRCQISFPGAGTASAARALTRGEWHHVVCVARPGAVFLYVDGAEVARTPHDAGARSQPPNRLHLGENADDGLDQLDGAIDDVRIWDAVWSQEDVRADRRLGRRGAP